MRLPKPLASKRKSIFIELQRRGLGVQVHYIPIPSQPYYRTLGYSSQNCPSAVVYYNSAISLPMFPKLTDQQIAFTSRTVKDVILSFAPSTIKQGRKK
jgi:dTDP-4-amino-4,6-dideoxygalactose transaminase